MRHSTLRNITQRAGRSAVAWSFGSIFLRLGATVILLPIIVRQVPSEELGLWYVFLAIGALASLVDFGFAPTVSRITAYVWAGETELTPIGLVQRDPSPPLENRSPNYELLERLVSTLRAYYSYASLALFVVLTVGGGWWVWQKTALLQDASSLRVAWIVYSFSCCLMFMNSLWTDLLTGINQVRQAQQIGVTTQVLYFVIAIVGLLTGCGFWSLVAANALSGIASRYMLRFSFLQSVSWLHRIPTKTIYREILRVLWPNAWRTGLVSLGGYMLIQGNTLICSAFLDLRATAAYGLSLQLVTTLAGVSGVWIAVKIPLINQLRTEREPEKIVPIFVNRMHLSLVTYLAGAVFIISAVPMLLRIIGAHTYPLANWPLAILLFIQLLEMHHALYATLVYTENINPFVRPALISGVAILLLSTVLTPRIGIWGLLISTGVVQACFNNWWPVMRAVQGLGEARRSYWSNFFDWRQTIARAQSLA